MLSRLCLGWCDTANWEHEVLVASRLESNMSSFVLGLHGLLGSLDNFHRLCYKHTSFRCRLSTIHYAVTVCANVEVAFNHVLLVGFDFGSTGTFHVVLPLSTEIIFESHRLLGPTNHQCIFCKRHNNAQIYADKIGLPTFSNKGWMTLLFSELPYALKSSIKLELGFSFRFFLLGTFQRLQSPWFFYVRANMFNYLKENFVSLRIIPSNPPIA